MALLLGSCGEIGTDERGPYKAYLVLQDEKGAERDFYLGGYNKLEDCFDILQYEAGDASERGYETWTNPEFTYGGRKQDGWIRHKIVGGFCAFVGK
ncbi:MAG: hypothetical protein WCL10_20145 [Novosphingobium sp.]|uniref:hypothetical protein n=1 Tax=Novosphingobium sp. TaxID=1874826 RepID=UPI003017B596